MTTSEMLRLACWYAEMDRLTYLDAISNCRKDPAYEKDYKETEAFIAQLRAYRQKRWGKTKGDSLLESEVKAVSVEEQSKMALG